MRELTLEEIQQGSFKVLLEFKDICEKNNFRYYLAYGTLIGALRHKGFIPWDDDVDVWMPRPDYEKFVQYCIDNKSSLGAFALKHFRTCKEYIYPIARLVDTRYKIDYTGTKDYGLGLFIDIYPLDGINVCDEKHMRKLKKLMGRISCLYSPNFVPPQKKWKTVFKYAYYILNRGNINKVIKKCDKLAQKYPFETSETFECMNWECRYAYNKQSIAETVQVDFNGEKFNAPAGYDAVLKTVYGDYMQLPPENERIAHHFYRAYSVEE